MNKEQIFNFIQKQKTALIASVDENGFPNVKAMLAPRKIKGHDFYFSTNTSSLRVAHYQANKKACIYFFRRGLFRYTGVMLIGTMQVLTDQSSKDALWRTGDTIFYHQGKTDPDYCVLKFTAQKCRIYQDLKTSWLEIWTAKFCLLTLIACTLHQWALRESKETLT